MHGRSRFGWRLFTAMRYLPSGEVERVYTSDPVAYPLSGRKPRRDTPWSRQVLVRGEPYYANDAAGIRFAFEDAEKIKQQLAEAEKRHQEILAQANEKAQKMIDEARSSAGVIAQRKEQEAIAAAEQILAKAREASQLEHERTMAQLKRELGRLVVDATTKVTGKVLTPEDQRRLQEEASRQVAA